MKYFTSNNTKKQTAPTVKLCWLAAILFFGFTATAANQVVTSNGDSGAGTLRQAIADVGAGETITFNLSAGNETIILTSDELLFKNQFILLI